MEFWQKIDESFLTIENGRIYRSVINDTEKILIEKALEKANGNQIFAARILGLNRNTLRTKIRKFGIKIYK